MSDQQQTTTAVAAQAKPFKQLKDVITAENFTRAIQQALPDHMKAERFIRVAITAMTRTPKLALCTQESFLKCLLDLSAIGLEPDGRNAHLIPFENRKAQTVECTLIVDFKGICQLVRRSGEVSNIHADVVYEEDQFEFHYGSNAFLKHIPALDGPRKKRKAVYSFVKMKDGSDDFLVWGLSQVEAIRNRSKAANNGPWNSTPGDYDEMAKKSVFRNQSKWLPLSSELIGKITRDDDAIDIEGNFELPDGGSAEAARAVADQKIAELKSAKQVYEESQDNSGAMTQQGSSTGGESTTEGGKSSASTSSPMTEASGKASDSPAPEKQEGLPAHTIRLLELSKKIGTQPVMSIIDNYGFSKMESVSAKAFEEMRETLEAAEKEFDAKATKRQRHLNLEGK